MIKNGTDYLKGGIIEPAIKIQEAEDTSFFGNSRDDEVHSSSQPKETSILRSLKGSKTSLIFSSHR